jgi:cysteine desulfurase
LNKKDIFVSTGAACSSGKKTPSHVLLAMGKSITEAMECIRISISKWTTKDEIDRFLVCLKDELSE